MKAKWFMIGLLVLTVMSGTQAQSPKIGYTNADYILSLLPEAKQIEADLKSLETQLQKQLQAKYQDLQNKIADYQQNAANYTQVVRADKEQEINALQTSIQEFQQKAENTMVNKRNELLSPAYEKIGRAIENVAKENNYDFIFSAGSPGLDILLYAKEESDVSDLILKKLGITPPKK
jgi:outer membrane protein